MTKEEKAKLLEDGKSEVEIIQLEEIEKMKLKMDAMVDPEKFAELEEQYKTLLNDYVNKRPAPKKEVIKARPTKEIAAELAKIENGNTSNREYIEKALEYRTAHMLEFGTDPFSDDGESTDDSIEVAGKLQKLIDENESPVDFRIKMNSVLKDDSTLVKAINKRKNKK